MLQIRYRSDKGVIEMRDSETGDRIRGAAKVEIEHVSGARPVADVQIVSTEMAQIDIDADAHFNVISTVDGKMKRVKMIEFEDGEIINYGEPE